jgi:hypothetical protein
MNVVLRRSLLASNMGRKGSLFADPGVAVCGRLQVPFNSVPCRRAKVELSGMHRNFTPSRTLAHRGGSGRGSVTHGGGMARRP